MSKKVPNGLILKLEEVMRRMAVEKAIEKARNARDNGTHITQCPKCNRETKDTKKSPVNWIAFMEESEFLSLLKDLELFKIEIGSKLFQRRIYLNGKYRPRLHYLCEHCDFPWDEYVEI